MIIALGISMIIVTANISFMVAMLKTVRGVQLSQEMIEFVQRVMLVTFKAPTCSAALAGEPFNAGTPQAITFKDPSGVVTAGTVVGGLRFTNVVLQATAPTGTPGEYFANLVFSAEKMGDVAGAKTLVRFIPVRINVLGAAVSNCTP